MSLASFIYEYGQDKDGEEGWLLKPEFNVSMSSTTFAHDIVEHHIKDNGSVEHELMALGAVLFGRYQMGYATDDGIASDIAYMFTDTLGCLADINEIKYVRKLNNNEYDGCVNEDTIEHIMDLVKIYVKDTIESYYNNDLKYQCELESYIKYAKMWIRKGFRLANKRFKTAENMLAVYNTVSKVVKNNLEYGYYGQSLRITYQISPEPKAWCKVIHN